MSANYPQVITKASLWVDGNQYLGELEEVKLPDVETITQGFRSGSSAGEMQVPVGTNLSTAEFMVRKYDEKIYQTYGLNAGSTVKVTVRAAFQQGGEVKTLTADLQGTWAKLPGGTLKTGEFSDQRFEMHPQVYNLKVNGVDTLQVDIPNGVVKVGEQDVLKNIASAIGL